MFSKNIKEILSIWHMQMERRHFDLDTIIHELVHY